MSIWVQRYKKKRIYTKKSKKYLANSKKSSNFVAVLRVYHTQTHKKTLI